MARSPSNEGRSSGAAGSPVGGNFDGVITVNGGAYAVGLQWAPLQNADSPMIEVREGAEDVPEEQIPFDMYCVRKDGAAQYALGLSEKGHRPGMSVGAAMVANAINGTSFVAVFKVPEGWWFVSVRNDLILPDEDRLYRKEAEAKDAFDAMMAVPDWSRMIAPLDWGLPNTEQVDLAEVLGTAKLLKLNRLRPANYIQVMATRAVIGMALVFGLWQGAGFLYDKLTYEPPPPPKIVSLPKEPQKALWEKQQLPVSALQACEQVFSAVTNIGAPGWRLEGMDCTPVNRTVVTQWRRSYGTLSLLERGAAEIKEVLVLATTPNETGEQVEILLQTPEIEIGSRPPGYARQAVQLKLSDFFQSIGESIQFRVDKSTGGNRSVVRSIASPEQPKDEVLMFRFGSSVNPGSWASVLGKVDGLIISRVTYRQQSSSGGWLYEGSIFVGGTS